MNTRRKFIKNTAAFATSLALIDAHFSLEKNTLTKNETVHKNLIDGLILPCHASIEQMKKFYGNTIGLPILETKDDSVTIKIGLSTLKFIHTQKGNRPFYHFAFNIPENKIDKAFQWQKEKTVLINPRPNQSRNPMKEIVHFPIWNAHSIFFNDPAGNLVEYIALHDLKNGQCGAFTINDILHISEIGLVVEDRETTGNELINHFGLGWYKPDTNGLWVVGGNHGMLLMINPGNNWTAPEGQVNLTAAFETTVIINSTVDTWKHKNYPYTIISK